MVVSIRIGSGRDATVRLMRTGCRIAARSDSGAGPGFNVSADPIRIDTLIPDPATQRSNATMPIVGLRVFEIHIHGTQSLKEKRFVLKSVKDRISHRFNVSIAETDHQDKWQRAQLSVAAVATDRAGVEKALDAIRDLLDREPELRVIDILTDIG